jgi:integrase
LSVVLAHVKDRATAAAFATALQDGVTLIGADHALVARLVAAVGKLRPEELSEIARVAAGIARGDLVDLTAGPTVSQLIDRWTSGAIDAEYPGAGRGGRDTRGSLLKHCPRELLQKPVATVTTQDAESLKRAMGGCAPATIAQTLRNFSRLMTICIYPLRLRTDHPVPKGLNRCGKSIRREAFLYPLEEATLLRCEAIPMDRRILYGFLHREGLRTSEALKLRWTSFDLKLGVVTMYAPKTSDPRAWKLHDDVTRALITWRATGIDRPFSLPDPIHGARTFREDLVTAGIDRPELFERSNQRQPIRLHDARGGFVTLALAFGAACATEVAAALASGTEVRGATEAWVCARTGHRTSAMLNKYRRTAHHAMDLGLGFYLPMDTLLLCHEVAGQCHEVADGPGDVGVKTNDLSGNETGNTVGQGSDDEREVAAVLPSGVGEPPTGWQTSRSTAATSRSTRDGTPRSAWLSKVLPTSCRPMHWDEYGTAGASVQATSCPST